MDKIYIHKAKEAQLSGSNVIKAVKKWKATAGGTLRSHDKCITAGLLATAGSFLYLETSATMQAIGFKKSNIVNRVQEK